MFRIAQATLLSLLCLACAEKAGPEISIQFTGSNGFADPNSADLVFVVTNLATSAGILDINNDGQPDQFVFPQACGATPPAGCGYTWTSGSKLDVGDIPLNFSYQVDARFRNAAGTTIYSGSITFTNSGDPLILQIPLAAAP